MNVGISGEIDLGDVNPLNYKKIDFLGDASNLYTKISWGNTPYYGKSIKDFFNERNNGFHDIIVNSGSIYPILGQIQSEKQKELIKISDKQGQASFEGNIKFGLSFYWKNNHFYLRIPVNFYAETWTSFSGGEVWAGPGNGIKFYN